MTDLNSVSVFSSQEKFKKLATAVRKAAVCSLEIPGKRGVAVEIFLVSNRAMKRLNENRLGKDRVTNVLSFGVTHAFPRPDLGNFKFAGEIFLAPDYIRSRGEEVGYLTVHGILHLLGYTHAVPEKSIIMGKLERKIWATVCQEVKTRRSLNPRRSLKKNTFRSK